MFKNEHSDLNPNSVKERSYLKTAPVWRFPYLCSSGLS